MTVTYSLRRRLLLWLFLATAVIGVIALADTWREALRTAQGVSDRVLAGSALAIAERVTVDETGGLEVDLPYSSLEMLASTAQDRVFYRVDAPSDRFLTGYQDLAVVPVGEVGIAFADGVYQDVRIRSATLRRELSTGAAPIAFTVTVAESTLARDALARTILLRSAVRLMVMFMAVVGIVWVAVTLALRPLDRLVEAIAQRSPDDLRPVTARTVQEVELLVEAINSFMQRLDTALGALKNFTGNASHQLRTPLAVVRTQLALAARSTSPAQADEAARKAETALVRAERVLAQLLALARVDAAVGTSAPATADLAAEAKALSAEMVPAALRFGVDLGYDGPDTAIAAAEPVLFSELLRNLIDNAITYAGAGAEVTVRVRRDAGGVLVEVEDNGPGLPPDRVAAVLSKRRSLRAAPGPDAPQVGYGLGLSIVAEIASLFGAELVLGLGQTGAGLCASVRFRAA